MAEPQLRMLKEAFALGMDISSAIVSDPDGHSWHELYSGPDFFERFNDYIEVGACSILDATIPWWDGVESFRI